MRRALFVSVRLEAEQECECSLNDFDWGLDNHSLKSCEVLLVERDKVGDSMSDHRRDKSCVVCQFSIDRMVGNQTEPVEKNAAFVEEKNRQERCARFV